MVGSLDPQDLYTRAQPAPSRSARRSDARFVIKNFAHGAKHAPARIGRVSLLGIPGMLTFPHDTAGLVVRVPGRPRMIKPMLAESRVRPVRSGNERLE